MAKVVTATFEIGSKSRIESYCGRLLRITSITCSTVPPIAVRARMRDRGTAQRTAAATDVLDDHRAEQCLQLVRQRPAQSVECAAGRKRDHKPNRPRRIGLRARHGR